MQTIFYSLHAMSVEQLIEMAHHPTSSRVLDAVLESPTVPFKSKRKFVMTFIGHYHLLVDDRIGSRVGDRCWAAADPYLKACRCSPPSRKMPVSLTAYTGKDCTFSNPT